MGYFLLVNGDDHSRRNSDKIPMRYCELPPIRQAEGEGPEAVLQPLFDLIHEHDLRLTLAITMFKRIPDARLFAALQF